MKEKREILSDKSNFKKWEPSEESFYGNDVCFKINMDYIGRSYSVYIYFILVLALTTTTYLISLKTGVNGNLDGNPLTFSLPYIGQKTVGLMYGVMGTWFVFFLALDFVKHRHVNKYNKIISNYFSGKEVNYIERKSYLSKIFILPAKLISNIVIPLLEFILSGLKKIVNKK